jgi:hypothetical protein
MNAKYYNGDDDRDGLTAPDDCGCWSCGVDADTPCGAGCECAYCQRTRAVVREEAQWTPCYRTVACVHRHGHGGECLPRVEVTVRPAEVYAFAVRAGLDMVAELQRGRS